MNRKLHAFETQIAMMKHLNALQAFVFQRSKTHVMMLGHVLKNSFVLTEYVQLAQFVLTTEIAKKAKFVLEMFVGKRRFVLTHSFLTLMRDLFVQKATIV